LIRHGKLISPLHLLLLLLQYTQRSSKRNAIT